ncbi:quinolinate synthase NadA [uncultured Prochlorococcus sp.]|uniref:quinolinate synthase NadA n=1 Tax=Prochlorococcus sp. TaxID=1220 RepID=UPI000C68D512|nr:quinolinate synthase NadA [uncultured Prochlorococcus sp.]MAK08501.1 quinolinate synthase [Prochlorococcus sp. MED105]RCL49126.1 MAG: quinolinate synthase NadA [Prochlorococcus sp. MED-G72]
MTSTAKQKSIHNEKDLISEIKELCLKANAIILAHYYQAPEIQDIADFIGDSLDLSRKAANNDADIIIFCGVHFMAETAKILSPNKTVLLPDIDAGCSLADDCPAEEFQKFREENPDHYVVSYINCTAEVKAQSDLICTSSNAVSLVEKIPKDKKIIFAPDKNLGRWVQKNSGRKLKLWPGSCIVHETFSEEALLKLKYKHPDAKVIAHPECSQNLLVLSDFIGSTSKLLDFVSNDYSDTYMVLTEPGIIHQMKKKEPNKNFIEVPDIDGCKCNECPYMKLNTLEKILDCLKNNSPSIELDPEIIKKAYKPIKRMLDMSI